MMNDMKKIAWLIGVLAIALPVTASATEVTLEICKTDYEAMAKTAEDNRARSVAELESALRLPPMMTPPRPYRSRFPVLGSKRKCSAITRQTFIATA